MRGAVLSAGAYMPANGGALLPIVRLGRLGWFIEGEGWTMAPRESGRALTLADEKRICQAACAGLRAGASE